MESKDSLCCNYEWFVRKSKFGFFPWLFFILLTILILELKNQAISESFQVRLIMFGLLIIGLFAFYFQGFSPHSIIWENGELDGISHRKGREVLSVGDISDVVYEKHFNFKTGLLIKFKNGRKWRIDPTITNYKQLIERFESLGYLK